MSTAIVFGPQTVTLQPGTLEPQPDGSVALSTVPGTYISVQPDGRVETRTQQPDGPPVIGPWEVATRVGTMLLKFSGAGADRYMLISETGAPQPPAPPAPPPQPADLTADHARQIVYDTAAQFAELTQVFNTDQEATDAAVELLEHTIWHLQRAGFTAGRQRNPSNAISGDKLTILIDGAWHAYDIFSLGYANHATKVQFVEIGSPNNVPDSGIPD